MRTTTTRRAAAVPPPPRGTPPTPTPTDPAKLLVTSFGFSVSVPNPPPSPPKPLLPLPPAPPGEPQPPTGPPQPGEWGPEGPLRRAHTTEGEPGAAPPLGRGERRGQAPLSLPPPLYSPLTKGGEVIFFFFFFFGDFIIFGGLPCPHPLHTLATSSGLYRKKTKTHRKKTKPHNSPHTPFFLLKKTTNGKKKTKPTPRADPPVLPQAAGVEHEPSCSGLSRWDNISSPTLLLSAHPPWRSRGEGAPPTPPPTPPNLVQSGSCTGSSPGPPHPRHLGAPATDRDHPACPHFGEWGGECGWMDWGVGGGMRACVCKRVCRGRGAPGAVARVAPPPPPPRGSWLLSVTNGGGRVSWGCCRSVPLCCRWLLCRCILFYSFFFFFFFL